MSDFIRETAKILRDYALKQESLNSQSYGEFRDSFNKAFDHFEELMKKDAESSPTKTICHNFLDQWIDEVNHDFQVFYGIGKEQWPVFAKKLANELEAGGVIKDPIMHEKFILKPKRSLLDSFKSLFKR